MDAAPALACRMPDAGTGRLRCLEHDHDPEGRAKCIQFFERSCSKVAAAWPADPDRAWNMMNFLQIVIPF
jgi:hypothetical protein